MIYSLCTFYPIALCIWECTFIFPPRVSGGSEEKAVKEGKEGSGFRVEQFDCASPCVSVKELEKKSL